MIEPDLLETVTPAAAGATRRLTTKEKVKTALEITVTTWDTLIDQYIDQLSDVAADCCNLARDNAGAFPTFGAETLRATWRAYADCREGNLLMPWRPKIAITSLTEGGFTLAANTDYRLNSEGALVRLSGGYPYAWDSSLETVVTFTAGWTLPAGVPVGLEGEAIEQVKYRYLSRARDPSVRSRSVQDVGAQTFSVPAGDNISETGLLPALESALEQYRRIAV